MNWYHTPRWAKCCPVRLKDKIYCTNTPFAVCVCSHVHLIPVEMRRFITNLQIGLGCKLHFFKCKTICSSGDMIVNISCSFISFVNFPSFLKYTQVLSLSVTFCFLFADVQLCLLSIKFCPEGPGRWDDTYTLGYISPILCYRAFSLKWPAALQIYWNRREFLHEKKVKTFRTGLGHQHGRRFIVLGHQCVRRDVMWKCSCCVLFSLYFWYCLLPLQCPCQQDRPHDETEIFPTQAENAFVVLKLLFWAPVLIWKLGGNYVLRVWKKILKIVMRLISLRPAQSKC